MDDGYRFREVECMGCGHRFTEQLIGEWGTIRLKGSPYEYYETNCPKCGERLLFCWENGRSIAAGALEPSEVEISVFCID